MTSLALTLVIAAIVGHAIDRGALGAPARGVLETFGRALMLGLGALGAGALFLDGLGLGVSRVSLGVMLGVLVGAAALLAPWRGVRRAADASPSARSTPEIAACATLALFAAAMLAVAVHAGWVRPTYQFDALTRWMFKAKVIALDGSLLGPISTDPEFAFTHQRYPPLVSYVAALPAVFAGEFDDRIASALFPWYAVATVLVAGGALARRRGPVVGAVAAAWIASLPLLAYVDGPPPGAGAFSALADVPLGLFALGAGLAAADLVDRARPRAALECGLLLGLATLTKNEALPLVAGFSVGLLVSLRERRIATTLAVAGLALAIYVGFWYRLAATFPALDEHYPARLHADALREGLDRVPIVLERLARELLALRSWNLTWPAIVALLAVAGRGALARVPRVLLAVLFVQLASYVLAYVVTSWSSPAAEQAVRRAGGDVVTYLMDLTAGRLLMQVAPLAVVAALWPHRLRRAPAVDSAPIPRFNAESS